MAQLSDDCFAFGGSLLAIDDARRMIADRVVPVAGVERVPLRQALGRILGEDITAPIAVRWSPSAVCTSGGTKALRSGPVTPAKSPPKPTHRQTSYGIRADRAPGASGASFSCVTPQYC